GEESDAVITNAQDGSGFNNANFMTPPNAQNGRCRMYLWNTANPYRDGDMEADIVIHELAHSLSTRLTGGPKNSGCLGWGESVGVASLFSQICLHLTCNKQRKYILHVCTSLGRSLTTLPQLIQQAYSSAQAQVD
ncbi:Fungalysin metallopeptidase-domain-containing protein, partial [Suillus clintonianus]|uniref:Fungalysin metallopeptidase-domain-containing protein n=1 Tax=Suillus clintonianus TaxID=1904413 RepID=UPI001B86B722